MFPARRRGGQVGDFFCCRLTSYHPRLLAFIKALVVDLATEPMVSVLVGSSTKGSTHWTTTLTVRAGGRGPVAALSATRSEVFSGSGAGIVTGTSPLFFFFLCTSLVGPYSVSAVFLVRGLFWLFLSRLWAKPLAYFCAVRDMWCAFSPPPFRPFTYDDATFLGHLRMFGPTCVER